MSNDRLDELREQGRLRPPKLPLAKLPEPAAGPPLSPVLKEMRDDERY